MEKKPVSELLDEEFERYRKRMREIHPHQELDGKSVVRLMRSAFDYGAGAGMQIVIDELARDRKEVKQSGDSAEKQETLHDGGEEPGGSVPQE